MLNQLIFKLKIETNQFEVNALRYDKINDPNNRHPHYVYIFKISGDDGVNIVI